MDEFQKGIGEYYYTKIVKTEEDKKDEAARKKAK
jgi:hypothetical protein